MLISGSDEAIGLITADLETLASDAGMRAELTQVRPAPPSAPRSTYRLSGRALDQPGLVHEVANVLTRFELNIESMQTSLEAAAHTGAPVFAMELVVSVPSSADIGEFESELARLCDSLNIDWHFSPVHGR